ncbi:DUF6950 family protein [Sphingomonas sp.]|uniref:DUF6950 family protein n=1 Tax=Sphingomonas sp. TaxID=28214 RepID=UPI003B001EEA
MSEMLKRQKAAQAVLDRFKGKPMQYGKNDCARLAAMALRKMGHRSPMVKAGIYHSAVGALRAMKKLGFDDLAAAIDSVGLKRIAPAAALPGDLILIPGEGAFGGALVMAVSNGRVLGYHEDCAGAEVLQPVEYLAAWRL